MVAEILSRLFGVFCQGLIKDDFEVGRCGSCVRHRGHGAMGETLDVVSGCGSESESGEWRVERSHGLSRVPGPRVDSGIAFLHN